MKITPLRILLYSVIFQVVAFLIFLVTSAGGHGVAFPGKILFPYSFLSVLLFENDNSFIFVPIYTQYLFYGAIIAYFYNKKYLQKIYTCLSFFHIFIMLYVLIGMSTHPF